MKHTYKDGSSIKLVGENLGNSSVQIYFTLYELKMDDRVHFLLEESGYVFNEHYLNMFDTLGEWLKHYKGCDYYDRGKIFNSYDEARDYIDRTLNDEYSYRMNSCWGL